MVEKALVEPNERLFEAVESLVTLLNREHGPLYFAMLIHFPNRPDDEWTLLVGSKRLVSAKLSGYKIVARAIQSVIPAEFMKFIRRIAIVRADDSFVRAVAGAIRKRFGGHGVIRHSIFDEVEIEHAALYVAHSNGNMQRRTSRSR